MDSRIHIVWHIKCYTTWTEIQRLIYVRPIHQAKLVSYCVTICVGGNISAMKNLLIAYLNSVVLMGVFVIMQSCTDGWSYWIKYKDVLTLIVKKIKNVLVFMICVLPLIGSAEYLGLLRLMNLMTERY